MKLIMPIKHHRNITSISLEKSFRELLNPLDGGWDAPCCKLLAYAIYSRR
jgi:hypothetical protein